MRAFWSFLRDMRTYYLITFKPEYVKVMMLMRKGNCNGCECCSFAGCEHLKGKKCQIYKKRPIGCRMFPIDPFDLWIMKRIYPDFRWCRLWWDL